LPALVALHDTVAEPEPVTLGGVNRPQDRPDEGVMLKLTVPANPLTAATETVEVACWPTLTAAGEVVVRVKSWTTYVTVAEWDNESLVPVTPTSNVPADANVQERVELPEPVTVFGEILHEVLLVPRLTPRAKPLTGVTVIVEVAVAPVLTVMLVGFAEIVKSWTTNVTITEWNREPLVPVTDTFLLPVDVNVHDRVALPEPVTLVGETVQAEVLLVARLTMPAKPLRPAIVIVEVPGPLTLTLTLVGLAVTAKSWMV
jgi:hypothetical protein